MDIYITDEDETPVERMLLEALKQVTAPNLRREIEEALKGKTGKKKAKTEPEEFNAIEKKIAELKRTVKRSSYLSRGQVYSSVPLLPNKARWIV